MKINFFSLNCISTKLINMASFKDSFYSKLSGKIGTITTYVRNGTQIVRSITIPNDPKTPKQLAHRMKFALVNKGLSPLNDVIKLGHMGDTNAYRTLVGKAIREAIAGQYPNLALDYSKIKIANGDLQLPANILLEVDEETNSVIFRWDAQNSHSKKPAGANDQINIVAYNDKNNVVSHYYEIAKRLECKASIALPYIWTTENTHFWIYFSSYSLQMNSESVYMVL